MWLSALSAMLGLLIGVTAVVLMALNGWEVWVSERVIVEMLVVSFSLLFAACHGLDRRDKARTERFKSL